MTTATRKTLSLAALTAALAPALAACGSCPEGGCAGAGPGWFAWLLLLAAVGGAAFYVRQGSERNTELLVTIDDDFRDLMTKVARLEAKLEGAAAPSDAPAAAPANAPAAKKAAAPRKRPAAKKKPTKKDEK
ncbi:MAG: hypothetical protein KC466_06835 [Myxococcales bacterium]|nr:hypothetical protein [Myxococcales bacterium]